MWPNVTLHPPAGPSTPLASTLAGCFPLVLYISPDMLSFLISCYISLNPFFPFLLLPLYSFLHIFPKPTCKVIIYFFLISVLSCSIFSLSLYLSCLIIFHSLLSFLVLCYSHFFTLLLSYFVIHASSVLSFFVLLLVQPSSVFALFYLFYYFFHPSAVLSCSFLFFLDSFIYLISCLVLSFRLVFCLFLPLTCLGLLSVLLSFFPLVFLVLLPYLVFPSCPLVLIP